MSSTASPPATKPARARSAARSRARASASGVAEQHASPLEQILSTSSLQIVEALHEGVLVQDPEGRVIAFNDRAGSILQLSADQLAQASPARPIGPLIHEDGAPFSAEELPTVMSLRTGEPQSDVVMGVKQPDGSVRWIAVNSTALIEDGGNDPYAAVASFIDITELRETLRERDAARLKDVKRLALVAEYRDDETNRHTERVAHTAALLAMEMGLERELIWTIGRAAPLHDVGKVAIPDSILLKPGKLTAEEFEVMKTHTSIGGRILGESDFPVLRMGMEIALTHHERWDGYGYPHGLGGEEIPISGRIVAIADAFDAMSHPRPYHAALSIRDAVGEVEGRSGVQFDPEVVHAFMALDHHNLVEN
jgi:putative two-component system response regulator